jgi:hypothetical protein
LFRKDLIECIGSTHPGTHVRARELNVEEALPSIVAHDYESHRLVIEQPRHDIFHSDASSAAQLDASELVGLRIECEDLGGTDSE